MVIRYGSGGNQVPIRCQSVRHQVPIRRTRRPCRRREGTHGNQFVIKCPSDGNQLVIMCPSDAPVGHAEGEEEHENDRAIRVLRDRQTGRARRDREGGGGGDEARDGEFGEGEEETLAR